MEKPIIFSPREVRATLDGRKSRFTRVIKPQPSNPYWCGIGHGWDDGHGYELKCPYQPGDRLWVRETWAAYQTVNYIRKPDGRSFSEVSDGHFAYKADGFDTIEDLRAHIRLMSDCSLEAVEIKDDKWLSPVTMPREAARLFLTVKSVRVERVQEITEEDAIAEGVDSGRCEPRNCAPCIYGTGCPGISAIRGFKCLWDALNAKRGYGWEANPWVWVIEFERRA